MNVLAYVHMRNLQRPTGAGRVARELVEHVTCLKGINLHVLADRSDYNAVLHTVGEPWSTYRYHLFSRDTSIQQAKWLVLQSPAADTYWPGADIVHCTMEAYVPPGKSRLVVTVHDAAYFDGAHPRTFSTFKQQLKWRLLYDQLSRRVDIFHTVSNFSAQRLSEAFPSIRSRIRVVPNAVSSAFFEPASLDRDCGTLPAGLLTRKYILIPGGLHHRKNADLVLKAWPVLRQRIPDLELVIAGHNEPSYLPAARALGSSVVMTGFVRDEQLRSLYHGATAVWFPSLYEGFGIPVLEAMACGAPVVASNTTALPEVCGGAAVLVNPLSLDENVEALDLVVSSEALRADLRKRGKQRAAPFKWSASATQLHNIYSELA